MIQRVRVGQGVQVFPQNIRAVVFDFDGVMTDNSVIVDENGKESVVCNRSDGLGVGRLKAAGIPFHEEPHLRLKGKPGQHVTMFLFDPSGNALEFKSFDDPEQTFIP